MPLQPIRLFGDPVLRTPAEPVVDFDKELRTLVKDLEDTMLEAPGVGLAAPQVHVPLRVFVFRVPPSRAGDAEGEAAVGNTVLINPVVEPVGDEMVLRWEGCLSIPGLRAAVPRYSRVRYRGVDPEGVPISAEAGGFHAGVVQHENDHLDGILYIDRLSDSDWKTVQKIAKKRGWGKPGASWVPGVDDLEG